MSKTVRIIVVLVVVGAAAAVFLSRDSKDQHEAPPASAAMASDQVTTATETPDPPTETATPSGSTDGQPGLPRLVDLGSDRCIPCKMMAPILADLGRDFAGRMIIEVIDVRKNRSAAQAYGIRVIPTQVFFDPSGQERFRHEGFMSREAILATWGGLGVDLEPASPSNTR